MNGPGIEKPSIPEIDDIAKEYEGKRDERMTLLKQEVDAKKRLSDAMHKHGQTRYTYDDDDGVAKVVLCEPGKEKLKIKTVEAELEEGGDAED